MQCFLFISTVSVLFVQSLFGVQSETCAPTAYAMEVYTNCMQQNKTGLDLGICILQDLEIIDAKFIVNEQATMDSIKSLISADEVTLEKLTNGYTTCFTGFTGTFQETESVLQCIELMKKLACDEELPCHPHKPKKAEKCPASAQAIDVIMECMKENDIADFTEFENQENQHKFIPFYLCILKKAEIMDDNYIVNEDKMMESLDTLIITDDITKEKLTEAYKGCFVGFNGTAEETEKILQCTDRMKKWACEEPKEDECNNAGVVNGPTCSIVVEPLSELSVKCQTQSAEDEGTSGLQDVQDYTQEELNGVCVLYNANVLDENYLLNEQGFYDFFDRTSIADDETKALVEDAVEACIQGAGTIDINLSEKERIHGVATAFTCSVEALKKICLQQ